MNINNIEKINSLLNNYVKVTFDNFQYEGRLIGIDDNMFLKLYNETDGYIYYLYYKDINCIERNK